MSQVLEVRRDDLGTARVRDVKPVPLEEGQARFAVGRFGLTANNVTYGLFGDHLRYWDFFPSDEEGWGRVPAWGFAEVVESRCDDTPVGTRVFGFVPMGGEFLLTPVPADEQALLDASPHRSGLAGVYNAYRRAGRPSGSDDVRTVLQPLLVTAVLLARALEDAGRVVLSSASSKTALGTAYLLSRRAVEVVGITGSRDFARSLEVYDEVVGYDEIGQLARRPATFVDLAGDPRVRAAVHGHLGGELVASVLVGATHLDAVALPTSDPLPGPEPRFFFAPDHLGDGIDGAALGDVLDWATGWLEIQRADGPEGVTVAWTAAVRGELPPSSALSLALH